MPSSWPDAAMQTLKSMENLFLRVLALHPQVSQNFWTSSKVISEPKELFDIFAHTPSLKHHPHEQGAGVLLALSHGMLF